MSYYEIAMVPITSKRFEHHKKSDGIYNVKIFAGHKGFRRYLDTVHHVIKKQLPKDLKIRDPFLSQNNSSSNYAISKSDQE